MTIKKTIKFTEEEVEIMDMFTNLLSEVCSEIDTDCKNDCPFYKTCQIGGFDAYRSVKEMVAKSEGCMLVED